MNREQKKIILNDLEKKIVFIIGPRQVGKTWLAKDIARSFSNTVYLNYDRREDREIISQESWLESTELLILDELHKMKGWKNYLKGIYDTKPDHLKILVTGSARLDIFRQSGDSLAGRFFVHRLLPFSIKECQWAGTDFTIEHFLERGGFPEPLLANKPTDAKRWRLQYIDGLIRTDILDFEKIHDLRAVQLVMDLLREKVGSPISYKSIAEDVGIAPNTVKKYIQIFEALYIIFRVTPYSRNIARSLLKEPKIYFFDTGLIKGDQGILFENMVAVSLLKHVYGIVDNEGIRAGLHYIRTKEGKEIDFCLTEEGKAVQILEIKSNDANLSKNLLYFNKKYNLPAKQIVMNLKRQRKSEGIEIRSGISFLKGLYY